jgi:hypothetical protein
VDESALSQTRPFDLRALFRAVNTERERQRLSWSRLAGHVGVSASTMRRFAEADDAEADGVLAVLAWLGTAPEDFIAGGAVPGVRLAKATGGHVRVDMELVARALGEAGNAKGRTRTSIQRLAAVAQESQRPVASLTRLSPV